MNANIDVVDEKGLDIATRQNNILSPIINARLADIKTLYSSCKHGKYLIRATMAEERGKNTGGKK